MINNIHAGATPIKSRYHIATFEDRDDWLKLLLAAGELSPAAKVVGARVALHHNVNTGQCNPAIGTLVLGTTMSESTVRRRIDELEVAGWLRVDRTRGRHSNSFELLATTLSNATGFDPVNGDTVEEPNPSKADRVQDAPTLSLVTPQPCQNQPNPVTADTQNRESITANRTANRTAKERDTLQLDLVEEDSGLHSRDLSAETDAGFEIWYKQYPKHVDKADARKAYLAVIKKKLATPERLMAAAMRFAADYDNRVKSKGRAEAHQYTKNPATWLNKQSWLNEPADAGATYNAATPGQSNHIAVSEQIALQVMERDGVHVQ